MAHPRALRIATENYREALAELITEYFHKRKGGHIIALNQIGRIVKISIQRINSVAHVGTTAPGLKVHTHTYAHIIRSEEHTSELQSRQYLVCRLLLEKKT